MITIFAPLQYIISELKVSIKHWLWLNIDQIVTVKIPIYIFDRKPGTKCVIFSIWLVPNTNRFLVGIPIFWYWLFVFIDILVLIRCRRALRNKKCQREREEYCWLARTLPGHSGSQCAGGMTHQSGGGEDLGGRHAIQSSNTDKNNNTT